MKRQKTVSCDVENLLTHVGILVPSLFFKQMLELFKGKGYHVRCGQHLGTALLGPQTLVIFIGKGIHAHCGLYLGTELFFQKMLKFSQENATKHIVDSILVLSFYLQLFSLCKRKVSVTLRSVQSTT